MRLDTHHRIALTFALGLTAIAVHSAFLRALTGHDSIFSDESPSAFWRAFSYCVHGLAYVACTAVLIRERHRLGLNRASRVLGWMLACCLAVLAFCFLVVAVPHQYGHLGWAYDALGIPLGVAFGGHFVAALGLGLSVARRPEASLGARIHLLMVPAIGLTVLLAVFARDWAHPAYLEAVAIIGAALLGVPRGSARRVALATG